MWGKLNKERKPPERVSPVCYLSLLYIPAQAVSLGGWRGNSEERNPRGNLPTIERGTDREETIPPEEVSGLSPSCYSPLPYGLIIENRKEIE